MFGLTGKKLKWLAPLTGAQKSLADVPDPVFADKVLGDGLAIEPDVNAEGVVCSPCNGKIGSVLGHAVGIVAQEEGYEEIEMLIHVGINTVELKDGCFETLIKQDDIVKAGQPLIRFDINKIRAAEKATITPVVLTSPDSIKSMKILPGPYKAGETPFLEIQPQKKA